MIKALKITIHNSKKSQKLLRKLFENIGITCLLLLSWKKLDIFGLDIGHEFEDVTSASEFSEAQYIFILLKLNKMVIYIYCILIR